MTPVSRGKQLAALRRKARLRQRDVADLFGITTSAISEWERGVSTPSWHRLRTLDDAYGAGGSLLTLFGDDNGRSRHDDLSQRLDELAARMESLERWRREIEDPARAAQALDEQARSQGADKRAHQ